MSWSRHFPGRPSLLVLSIALTVGPGLSDALVRGASVVAAGTDRGGEPAALSTAPAPGTAALTLAGGDRGSGDRTPAIVAAAFQMAPGSSDSSVGCPGSGVDSAPRVRSHRDAVGDHSQAEPADGCRPAGPKRFHGAGARTGAATVAPAAAPATFATAATGRWPGSFNLYRKSAFVTQKDFRWCVAASVQMMVNIVRHRSDHTAATQERMMDFAQASDQGPWGPGGGTDVTGWIAALRHFGAGKYRAVGARTPAAALRIAATAMRQTGRPAGMLVMEGRHAWILHGFESRTDPSHDRRATISSVRVSGPLYPIQQKHGYDLRPNTELSVRRLAEFFQPSSVGALVGKYVVIVPVH